MSRPERHARFALALLSLLLAVSAARAEEPLPILVTGMMHLDPLATAPDSNVAINSYDRHRDAILWYCGLAATTGLRISAQMTGVYAEACIRRGNASDFALFMPGGPHHLGTHMHANAKAPASYWWRTIPQTAYANPDSCRLVVTDQLPWINAVFEQNGIPTAANDFFHGSHALYPGMDTVLWCPPTPVPVPYDNCFTISGSRRGWLWIHRGGWGTEPEQGPDTSCVKSPEVGGIIGFDQVHGPEGMVYGTLAYEKRDFLRVYLEWREMVRRGESSAVRHFNWMIHPYQIVTGTVGTDGVPVRTTITKLVEWLNANFIGRADESGHVMARYANAGEIRDAHAAWSAAHPAQAAALQATLAAGALPYYLPALVQRLDTCFYVDRVPALDTSLAIHQLTDRVTSAPAFVAWSRGGSRPLEPALTGTFAVLHGDGTTETLASSAIMIGMEPVVLTFTGTTGVAAGAGGALELAPPRPSPSSGSTRIGFTLPREAEATLALYDLAGRRVVTLVSGRMRAGRHEAELDASRLAPGLYVYRLDVAGGARVSKLLVAR